MKRTMTAATFFLGVSTFVAGCSTTSSDNVKTTGFYVTYALAQEGTAKPTATVTLQVGGSTGTYIDLSANDSLTVDGKKLERRKSVISSINYFATLDEKPNYVFQLTRPDEPAYVRTITHPAPFTLQETGKLTAAYTESITLHWNNSGTNGKMSVGVEPLIAGGGCTSRGIESNLPDSGTLTFSLDKIQPADKTTPNCSYRLIVSRSVSTDIGAPFEGGTMIARHTENLLLDVHP